MRAREALKPQADLERGMAAWRRRALELFPQLRRDLQRRDYSIYLLFSDLRPLLREAHDAEDTEQLRRIYGFAE